MDAKIKHITKNDPIIKKIIDDVGDCKIGKKDQCLFTYLIGLIIGQKIRFSTAQTKRSILYEITNNYNFEPNDILGLSDNDWNEINIEDMQKNTILRISHLFKNNFKNITKNDILELNKIKGIGVWTIQTLLIEYGLDYNLFPKNDKHVNKQLKKYYNIDECDIESFVEKFAPYKSVVFWFLWKHDL